MANNILVVGSANVDMVVKSKTFPEAGETLIGGKFFKFPGGKGANQAVAAARLGGDVTFVCKVGDDDFGQSSIKLYKGEGINTDYILLDQENPTGVALISVNQTGENKIVVAPGANSGFTIEDTKRFQEVLLEVDILVLQLEIPLPIITKVIQLAKRHGVRVILNPAPAQTLPEKVFEKLFLITPNEIETKHLTGITVDSRKNALQATQKFKDMGVQNVVITLGEKGAFMHTSSYTGFISTPKIEAVDTTAAGDVFNGALAVALTQNQPFQAAVTFACRAAAISVSKNGAQSSAPTVAEISMFAENGAESTNIKTTS